SVPHVRPPRVSDDVVSRPRLLERLDEGRDLLTVVVAPAGFGKTTLLAQWASMRAPNVAWLSLDDADAEPDVLWVHVLAAFDHAFPGFDTEGFAPTPLGAAELVERLSPGALVLDGYERIVGSLADVSLWRFAAERPRLQLVVSGRSEPSAPLAAARARGELLEIRTSELRLTRPEASAFVQRAGSSTLPTALVSDTVDLCGGWGAALRLAVTASSPAAWDGQLRELVFGEILAGRGEERAFLTKTSILEELSAPLCDAVLGIHDSEEMLARVERDQLLVERVVGTGGYRLDRAARRVLATELARAEPGLVRDLHRRAAAWYEAEGRPEAAIEHLLACGDTVAAGKHVGRSWEAVADAGGRARVLRWLEQVPASRDDVRLALARGWLLRLDGRRTESDAWLDAARAAAPLRARPAVVRACELARSVLPWDDVGRGMALARRAWRNERNGPRRAQAAWALGWASWWNGDLDAAAAALPDALGGPLLIGIGARAVLARIELARDDEDAAEALLEDAAAAIDENHLEELPELGMVATASGALSAARGGGASALEALERGIRLRRLWGHPLETADALVVAAPVAAVHGGRKAAAEMLGEARRLVAACPDPGILPTRLMEAARYALPRPGAAGPGDELTARERTVLRLLAQGRSKREIAEELYVSFNTVHSHTKAVYRKLGASSRQEAVERAEELGLV
ncbi:MAG TPA: LuxR C-terminal-related transcriptional regulator, partial [Gaiellaceae bacterium]|nr:LuxR C-terminal-related transcriptional regulator [Gaiellaceae bacterium]